MTTASSLVVGRPFTLKPTPTTDSSTGEVPVRLNGYGEQIVRDVAPTLYGLAEEGSLFLVTNAAISTGQTWVAAQTAFADTAMNFMIHNTEPVGGKSVRMHRLKLIATAASTAATAWHYAAILDPTLRAADTTHAPALTPVNVNGAVSNSTSVVVYAQNHATVSTIGASTAAKRIVARGTVGGLTIAGDELEIVFGGIVGASVAQTAATGAGQPGRHVTSSPPIMVPPQASLVISLWAPSSSASPAPEFELLFSLK